MEMPSTMHALCIWMIVAKFPSWFNAVLGERYNEWKAEFYRLYNLETKEDFELGWRDMINYFGLHTNRHINNLFALRTLWALPYLRRHFFAGMTTTGQSKSINAFIQRFLSAQTRLAHFVEQVCLSHSLTSHHNSSKLVHRLGRIASLAWSCFLVENSRLTEQFELENWFIPMFFNIYYDAFLVDSIRPI